MTDIPPVSPEKFGTLLGHAPGGVAIYSSHYPSVDPAEYPDRESFRSALNGVYMGYKWQCVEFARRWLYINHGCVFDDVAMAYDIFSLHSMTRLEDQQLLPVHAFRNGSKRPPEPGCMLIWDDAGEFEVTGHVAIVTEVSAGQVRFAEQNVGHHKLPEGRNWSRELPLTRSDDGGFFVQCGLSRVEHPGVGHSDRRCNACGNSKSQAARALQPEHPPRRAAGATRERLAGYPGPGRSCVCQSDARTPAV